MNPIAAELNNQLADTVAGRLLSDFGRRIFFPRGIVAQAAEASVRAKKFDATIGMAVEHRNPMVLDAVREQVPGLGAREMVAYSPTGGVQALRENWKSQMLAKNPNLAADECSLPMVVPGLTNGIFHASELFIDKDDDVIIPDMHWDNYELLIGVRRQAKIHEFAFFDSEHRLNTAGLSKLLSDIPRRGNRSKIILLLNFPNNPTGYTPTKKEATDLVAALKRNADADRDILVICDDAYFGLYYEEDVFSQSLFALLAGAHKNILAVKVDGSTKEDFVWGFRLGFLTFGGLGLSTAHYQCLLAKLTGSIRACISSSSSIGQSILQKAYASPQFQVQKSEAYLKLEGRYKVVRRIIDAYNREDSPQNRPRRIEPLPFNSGYFMAFQCTGINSDTLRLALLDRGIGTISLKDRYLRVAYAAVDEADLETLFQEIFETAASLPT